VSFKTNTVAQLDGLYAEEAKKITENAEIQLATMTKREGELYAIEALKRSHSQLAEIKLFQQKRQDCISAKEASLRQRQDYFQRLKAKKTEAERVRKRKQRKGAGDEGGVVDLTPGLVAFDDSINNQHERERALANKKQKSVEGLGKTPVSSESSKSVDESQVHPMSAAQGLMFLLNAPKVGEDNGKNDDDNGEDADLKLALYLSLESGHDRGVAGQILTFRKTNGDQVNAHYFDEELISTAMEHHGRAAGTARVNGDCLPDTLGQLAQKWSEDVKADCVVNVFTPKAVRKTVTSFVSNEQTKLPLIEEHLPLSHLSQDSARILWADKFKGDQVWVYECFLIAFGILTKRNVGIWINSSDDVGAPKPLLVKFNFAEVESDECDEVAFVNHNHWIPIFRNN
jgi:hypothetical protein